MESVGSGGGGGSALRAGSQFRACWVHRPGALSPLLGRDTGRVGGKRRSLGPPVSRGKSADRQRLVRRIRETKPVAGAGGGAAKRGRAAEIRTFCRCAGSCSIRAERAITEFLWLTCHLPCLAYRVPQAPLPTTPITMTAVGGASEPMVVSATIPSPGNVPATWSFEIQQQGVSGFTSLTTDTIGDVLLLVSYQVS